MRRLHVTGCHRSGTTLIFELIKNCYQHDAHCEHESSVFNPPEAPLAEIYFTKKPSDITHLKQILSADNNLYVIYIRRDPRDVITSIHPSRPEVYFSSFERWLRYQRAADNLSGHNRFIELEYEQLIQDPSGVQQTIEQQIPWLVRTGGFEDFGQQASVSEAAQISLGGVRQIESERKFRWQDHLPRISFQLQQYPAMPDVLIQYGYEQDNNWLECLQDVEPVVQQYGESIPGPMRKLETQVRYWLKSRRYIRSL